MAIENLYNVIRVTAADTSPIEAKITDEKGQVIAEGNMHLVIPDVNIDVVGTYNNEEEVWEFNIPNSELKGKYFYYFMLGTEYLDFAAPIYFL